MGVSNRTLSNAIRQGGATTGILRFFSRWRNRILVLTFAMAGLVRAMKNFVKIAADTEKQALALETVATNFGLSTDVVTKKVKALAEDGLFSIQAVSQAMKNLLSMGVNVERASVAIDTFKDSILANGKATISMDDALITGTQGLKEFRSQVSDNLGVMDR